MFNHNNTLKKSDSDLVNHKNVLIKSDSCVF